MRRTVDAPASCSVSRIAVGQVWPKLKHFINAKIIAYWKRGGRKLKAVKVLNYDAERMRWKIELYDR